MASEGPHLLKSGIGNHYRLILFLHMINAMRSGIKCKFSEFASKIRYATAKISNNKGLLLLDRKEWPYYDSILLGKNIKH